MLEDVLMRVRSVEDLSDLFVHLGYDGDGRPLSETATIVARWRGFRVAAVEAAEPVEAARQLARTLSRGAARGMAVAVCPTHQIAIAAPRMADRGVSRVLTISLCNPEPDALQHLARFKPHGTATALAHAARIDDLLTSEIAGERFFRQFHVQLERMSAALRGHGTPADRRMAALLALLRVLFLYFVQAKGWLDGRPEFLRSQLDQSLAKGHSFQRTVLDPLFFGTLNRPVSKRTTARKFGRIPYLNGGLFERHPAERRLGRAGFSNAVWREAFDDLFERFRFCVREAHEVDAIAPDMLGRVFERVMDTGLRHHTGTFYTPESLVRQIVQATIGIALMRRGLNEALVSDWLSGVRPPQRRHVAADDALASLRVLDPAVGSGAFLLGALEQLTALHTTLHGLETPLTQTRRRRSILDHNLFGVDLNPIAIRLAELRLWLAIVADDPTTDIRRVEPLPNLDGVVRQGDSLIDPIRDSAAMGVSGGGIPAGLRDNWAAARRAVFSARGAAHRQAVRSLHQTEQRIATRLLDEAIRHTDRKMAELASVAGGRDLFGERSGLDSAQRRSRDVLCNHRTRLVAARDAVRAGGVPFFSYAVHAADVIATGGFDVVLGNPPWVRAERVDEDTRRLLKARYAWWRASASRAGYAHLPDLAIAFLQRAFELTRRSGTVGFLLPSKVASASYAEIARRHLVRETTIHYLHRVPDQQAAAFGATTYPLALVASRATPPDGHRVYLDFTTRESVAQETLCADGPWPLVAEDVHTGLQRLRAAGRPLVEIAPARMGLKTGADAVLVGDAVSRDSTRWTVRFGGTTLTADARQLKPALRGRDVSPFAVRVERVVVWGYDTHDRPLPALDRPLAHHLHDHRKALLGRADYTGGPPWSVFRRAAVYARHRVVWPDLVRRPAAAYLGATAHPDAVPLNTCYVCTPRESEVGLLVAAVLNTTWVHALIRATADEARNGYRRLNARVADSVPIPCSGPATDRVIQLSQRAHDGQPLTPDELDEAVADALDLSGATRGVLRRFVAGADGRVPRPGS